MQKLTQLVWGPWSVYLVLVIALLGTLATVVVQVRGAAAGIRHRSLSLRWWLAAGTSMAAVGGVALSVSVAGPGAIFWMWIATALGAALTFGETALASSFAAGKATRHVGVPVWMAATVSAPMAGVAAVLVAVAGLAAFGMFQVHQTAATLHEAYGLTPIVAGIVVVSVVAIVGLAPEIRGALARLVPITITVYVLGCLSILARDTWGVAWAFERILDDAFSYRPIAGGVAGAGLTLAIQHGVMRAVMAGQLAIGASSAAVIPGESHRAPSVARRLMLGPLLTAGIVGTLTALVVLIGPAEQPPLVDGQRFLPLERIQSAGLRPSQDVGQTVVLPRDAGFVANQRYPMVLRSNPRGHDLWHAQLLKDENAIVVPNFGITRNIDHVIFRAKQDRLAKVAGFDVHVPVNRETVKQGAFTFLKLVPRDPGIDFRQVIARHDLSPRPHFPLADYHFEGTVGRALSPDPALGEHLAMFERRDAGAPENPQFHEFFRLGYRGPYVEDGSDRAPWGFVLADDVVFEPGAVLDLRFESGPRGADILRVDLIGELDAPPWDFLAGANTVVLRHEDDPQRDVHVHVSGKLVGSRWRFVADDRAFADFRVVAKMTGFSGPYLVTPPYDFQAVVRKGTRLSPPLDRRYVLVPLEELGEPTGPAADLPYRPHPGELLAAGMNGPVPARDGAAVVAWRFADHLGSAGVLLLVTVVALFAVTSMAFWVDFVSRALGDGALARTFRLLGYIGSAAAVLLPAELALSLADATIGAAAIPIVIGLGWNLGRIRKLAGQDDDTRGRSRP